MKLRDYLTEQNLTADQFAERVGFSKFAVGKWVRGERTPRTPAMHQIVTATKGKVGPADFFGLSEAATSDAA